MTSGVSPQHRIAPARRQPMDDHSIVQPHHRIAARPDEECRNHGMYETGQRGEEQRDPEPERAPLMLEVRLSDGARVLKEQAGEHSAPSSLEDR